MMHIATIARAAALAARLRVVVVRLDATRFRFALESRTRPRSRGRHRGAWSVDSAPAAAVLAFNTGQFTPAAPWGWVVRDGQERRTPGVGPLSMAVVADGAALDFVPAAQLPAYRATRQAREAGVARRSDGDGRLRE